MPCRCKGSQCLDVDSIEMQCNVQAYVSNVSNTDPSGAIRSCLNSFHPSAVISSPS